MDWTLIFDENGEEDLVFPHLFEEHPTVPRLARLVNRMYDEKSTTLAQGDFESMESIDDHRLMQLMEGHGTQPKYTLQALYFLTINYILGVGCLGIPYAFARSGFILCSIILLSVSLLSYMTVMWVAETGVRFELTIRNGEDLVSEETSLLRGELMEHLSCDTKRYEVVDLVLYYLGSWHKFIYQSSLMALMYVGLLAYSQVFSGAIATLVWGSGDSDFPTGIPQLIFGVMVVPLSCMEIDEQIAVQSAMAYLRFFAIAIMIVGSLLGLLVDNHGDMEADRQSINPPFFAPVELDNCQMSYTACFSGFGVAFSTALFSQLFQHSVPGLLRPLREQPDKVLRAPRVFGASLITTFFLYLVLGASAASFFGANTKSSVNLNFSNFNLGLDPQKTPPALLFLLKIASKIVVMFPAIDTISVFPLIANTLGNNFYAGSGRSFLKWVARILVMVYDVFFPVEITATRRNRIRRYSELASDDRREMIEKASQFVSIFWRLIAAFPPLLFSIWATDLSFSLLLAGVAGIYVAFIAPCLLQMCSTRTFKQATIFAGWYSSSIFTYPVLGFAAFALVMVLLQIKDAVISTM